MKFKLIILTTITILATIACKKSDSVSSEDETEQTSSLVEAALSDASSHASSSEGGTKIGASSFIESSDNQLNQMATTCTYVGSKTCSAGVGTVNWNSCTIEGLITMTGGWTETWTVSSSASQSACQNSYLPTSGSVSRSSTGSIMTFKSGATVTTDTQGGTSSADGTVFSSGSIITSRSSNTRTITMSSGAAIHRVRKGRLGRSVYDIFVVPNLTITGTKENSTGNGLSGNRTVSGTSTTHHNLAKYTATHTFNSVAWGNSTCCYPTSGSISTSYSGTNAPSNSSTLTFSTTCGSAQFTTTTGSTTSSPASITLENCE